MPKTKPAGSEEQEATFEALLKKRPRESKVIITSTGDDGEELSLAFRMRAIGSKAYDDLVAAHPPKGDEKKNGAAYHTDTFAPALIAAVSLAPKLTYDQAAEIYNSDDWSGGEIGALFLGALRLCNAGLDVPFTATD